MKVKVNLKDRLKYALGGIKVVTFEKGEQEVPEEVADYIVQEKLGERIKEKKEPAKDPTVDELKAEAKALEIEGYGSMKKADLIIAITTKKDENKGD